MNWLDIILILVLSLTTFIGLAIGIIKAALSLVGLIAGVILAGRYYPALATQLTFIPQESIAKVAAAGIILIGIMIIAGILVWVLKRVASLIQLGWVDRLGGAILGLILGVILCGTVLAIIMRLLGLEGVISESVSARILLDQLPIVLALLPSEFDTVRSFFY
ncbi:CvpA family protein [Chloroflexota bacterium]